jgi:sensor histidine kinase YesM
MKTRGYIDLYLPRKWAYHIKIILASIIVVIIWKTVTRESLRDDGTFVMFVLLFIQFELFIWLGRNFFSNISYTTPKEYTKKAILRLIVFFMVAFLISVVIFLIVVSSNFIIHGINPLEVLPEFLRTEYKGFLIGAGAGYLIGSLVFFYVQWVETLKDMQKLKEEKLVFQYETLKNQVNPHFLFNSLNTLTSLVSKDVKLSEIYIHKLSAIYRYILENKDLDHINLKNELDFVIDYFYLQKVRDDGKIDLKVNIKDPENYEILPISLQLLVENAFKHNAATREDPLKIEISLNESDRTISVSNNLKPKTQISESSKLGLNNLSERNKLITGREIEIHQSEEDFTVIIPLKNIDNEGANN